MRDSTDRLAPRQHRHKSWRVAAHIAGRPRSANGSFIIPPLECVFSLSFHCAPDLATPMTQDTPDLLNHRGQGEGGPSPTSLQEGSKWK